MDRGITASRIKALREAQGLTQQQLGVLIGRVKNTIYNYENEIQFPYEKDLRAIAVALNTTVAYLIGDINDCNADVLKISREFDYLVQELAKQDSELITMFRDISNDWKDYSDKEKRVVVSGLRFVLSMAEINKNRDGISDDA